jgi:DNA polymerase III delta subunit
MQAYKDGKVAEAQQMFCELAEQGVEVAQVLRMLTYADEC